MLKKSNRIRKNKEFDLVFKTGQSFYEKTLGFRIANNGLQKSRLGILISTKVSKKAVLRNHFKRQIREIFQAELPRLKTGKDLVIIVLPQILNKNFKDIEVFLRVGFKHLNLYK
jgi:ribonuclease P protein component